MNRQDIFNKVYTGMIKQGCQAFVKNTGSCKYLTNDNLKCAIGQLIPDGHDAQFDDGVISGRFLDEHDDLAKLWGVESNEDIEFLGELQSAHDECGQDDFVEEFRARMAHIAINHNLSIPKV